MCLILLHFFWEKTVSFWHCRRPEQRKTGNIGALIYNRTDGMGCIDMYEIQGHE